MKKWIALGLMSALALSLVGCSNSNDTSSNENTEEVEQDVTEENDDYIFDEDEDEEVFVEAGSSEVFLESFNSSPTIEETLLWDEYGVKVTATSLSYSSWSVTLNLTIENNNDGEIIFAGGTSYSWYAINGYSVYEGYISRTLEPGEVVETGISFSTDSLASYGINEIADIQLSFQLTDEDGNRYALPVQKLETSIADSYDYNSDTYQQVLNNGTFERLSESDIIYMSNDELYSNNGISMISEVLIEAHTEYDDVLGLILEVDNESEYKIYGVISDVYVNDVLVYDYIWTNTSILPGTKGFLEMNLVDVVDLSSEDDVDLDLLDDGVDTVTFTFSVRNEDYIDALTPQEITINFN